MSDKYVNRYALSQAIIILLKDDPEAFKDLASALTVGMQAAMEEKSRQQMVYYNAMIAAIQMSDKKLPKQLEELVIDRILEGCKGRYCGVEQDAMEKFSKKKDSK